MIKKAIVLICFGCRFKQATKRSIAQIEASLKKQYPSFRVETAFMSELILSKASSEAAMHILSLSQCLEQLLEGGIDEVYLQPTFITYGYQYQKLLTMSSTYEKAFKYLKVGKPLLDRIKDYKEVVDAFVGEHLKMADHEAAICMGHGSDNAAAVSFAALDHIFKEKGYDQYFVATLRGFPSFEDVLIRLKRGDYQKIYLYPFTLMAGYHVRNDLIGDKEDTWKRRLEKEGYEAVYQMKGLGEYRGIRRLYERHVKELIGIDYIEQ